MNPEPSDWTIMVYMAGDNNLSVDMAYALRDIREVAKARNEKINLMVYYDGSALDTPTLYCDFSDYDDVKYVPAYTVDKAYNYKDPKVAELASSPDENAATMYSILNFVDWCVSPKKRGKVANRYALIFSGHGFGFQSVSFLVDETSNYYMTISKLRITLLKIRDELLRQPIDLVGFDSCVMGMLEIAEEIREFAGTMISSEGSIPNAGWTYGNILGGLVAASPAPEPREVAKRFVNEFIDSQKEFSVGGVSVDMTAWNLEKTPEVVRALDKLGELLLYGVMKDSDVYSPLRAALIQSHWDAQSYMFEQNVDLKDFCERLLEAVGGLQSQEQIVLGDGEEGNFVELLKLQCSRVRDAVDASVLASGFSGGAYQYSNGIALFFPWTFQTYLFSERSYSRLQFAKGSGANWNAFLFYFLGEVTLRGHNTLNGRPNPLFDFSDGSRGGAADRESVGAAEGEVERRITANPANRIIAGVMERITANPANRIVANPANRIVANPANRLYNYPANRIVQNAANRIITNPANRITANPANRMLSGSDGSLGSFKNVASPWDIYGYSKEEEKSEAAGNK